VLNVACVAYLLSGQFMVDHMSRPCILHMYIYTHTVPVHICEGGQCRLDLVG
jgi:hypothetical protein